MQSILMQYFYYRISLTHCATIAHLSTQPSHHLVPSTLSSHAPDETWLAGRQVLLV